MKLKTYRKQNDFTYDELATKLGVVKSTAWRMCNGWSVDRDTAARVSALTRGVVTVEDLLYPDGLPKGAVMTERRRGAARHHEAKNVG